MNVVWILGSGFSKPLGGPTLADVFSGWRLEQAGLLLPELDGASVAERVERLFGTDDDRAAGRRPWANAEELLDVVDAAADDPDPEHKMVLAIIKHLGESPGSDEWFEQLHRDCRRVLAAVCHAFLEGAKPDVMERWEPYREWISQLQPQDTVLTFNYDLVIERLLEKYPKFDASDRARVLLPSEINEAGAPNDQTPMANVLKLHGSVDWRMGGRGAVSRVDVKEALSPGRIVGIASPGMTKASLVQAPFEPLWRMAVLELGSADVIVFVGYRFPETDAIAKRRLLNAIKNRRSRTPLAIHAVLGPNKHHPALARLEGMLEWALKRGFEFVGSGPPYDQFSGTATPARLFVQPMYAEDFMAVFDRAELELPDEDAAPIEIPDLGIP